ELRVSNCHTALMSGEHCSSRLLSDEEVTWLRDFLREFFDDIRVLVYIRRQDHFLLSTYSTDMKAGGVGHLHIPDEDLRRRRYDYWELLSRWTGIFGRENVTCRKFEPCSLKNADVVGDYAEAVGLGNLADYEPPKRLNQSRDAVSLEFLRSFNTHIPRMTEDGVNELRGNIVQLLAQNSTGPLLTLPPGEMQEFMNGFAESN